jgi:L-malate glycosyltransferase
LAEPVHILFIIDSFFGVGGGAEGALIRTVARLPKDRFRCTVVTFRGETTGEHARQLDCPLRLMPLTSTYNWTALKTGFKLRKFIREEKVAVVHTFFETADLWGAPIAWLAGCRRIISSRRDMGILRVGKHRHFYRLLGSIYSQVHTVSNEVGKFVIREDGLDPARVMTVYNGIDASRFGRAANDVPGRATIGAGGASHVVLSVGNIRRVKGFDTLIDAAAVVCQEFPAACFVVVGHAHENDTLAQLEAQRDRLGLGKNVVFLGERHDIPGLLTAADIFCLSSRSEGLSNAVLEAMASSLPVVATSVGGNPETVSEGESGYLVPSEDAKALAGRLLDLMRDPARARMMGEAGRRIVQEKFTVEAMVARVVASYEALLSNKPLSPK